MNTDQASHIAGMFQSIGAWMRQHAADNPMAAAAESIGKRIMQAAEDLKSMGDDWQPPADEPPADPAPADPPAEAPITAPDEGTAPDQGADQSADQLNAGELNQIEGAKPDA